MKNHFLKNIPLVIVTIGIFTVKANIVFIFADNMGYGDVSINNHFSRVFTPAIFVSNFFGHGQMKK